MKQLHYLKMLLAFAALALAMPATQASAAAPAASTRWGLGLSSSTGIIGMSSVSSIHLLDDQNAIQTYFGVSGSAPFIFGMGGIYKNTVSGGRKGGLHIGGGLGLGTTLATGQ